jgi:hypothetical protein
MTTWLQAPFKPLPAGVDDEPAQPRPSVPSPYIPNLLRGKDEEQALFLQVRRRSDNKADLGLMLASTSSFPCC